MNDINYGLFDVLTLIGSLGMFLFGMKMMSEGLQKVAGDRMRAGLAAITSNRVKGVLTGTVITAIIQSSSATSVMVVGFVNAGLLSVMQSFGVIMGANIGTTITAWIISILGFTINISIISLPLIGLGFPLIFSKINNRKYWGEFIIGFALVFLGLQYLQDSFPRIDSNPHLLEFLENYNSWGFFSTLIFVVAGFIVTLIIQSSSASMALTLVMCYNGWVSIDMAMAMIMGANIGTTITANLAAIVANTEAKRAALFHLLFNLIGAFIIIALFPFIRALIEQIITITNPAGFNNTDSFPVALSIFHSLFNIITTLTLIGFTKNFSDLLTKLLPGKESETEFKIKYINSGLLSTSELSLLQARKEIATYAESVSRMFNHIMRLANEINDKAFYQLYEHVERLEEKHDKMEIEIAKYLTRISEEELSELGSRRLQAMFRIINEIEIISDANYHLAKTLHRKRSERIWFTQEMRNNINEILTKVGEAMKIMVYNIGEGYTNIEMDKAYLVEQKINLLRDNHRNEHLKNIEEQRYNYFAGILYNDLFLESEKIGDAVYNVSVSISEIKK